jgi:hypothetical protein
MAGIARYPKDFTADDVNGTDYMLFTAQRKDYASQTATGANTSTLNLGAYNDGYKDDTSLGGGTYKVILYMPQKITENYSQGWTNNTLGPEVGTILAGIPKIALKGTPPVPVGGGGSTTKMMVTRIIEEYLMGKAIQGAGRLGASSLTANSILSATGGVIYNPMMEVLYDGPDFRRFNYEFTLFAKSEADAQEIYKIVNFFRFCSVPTYGASSANQDALGAAIQSTGSTADVTQALSDPLNVGNLINSGLGALATNVGAGVTGTGTLLFSGDSRFVQQPPFVRVQYRRNATDHPYILNPKPCALTNLNIDFTPTGNYTVLDNFGSKSVATVVATTISFSLTEIKALYSEDIANQLSVISSTNSGPG